MWFPLSDVCIVGLGPWGLCVLERLVDAARRNPETVLRAHVVEPGRPGGGIFSLEHPDYFVLNTPCGQHSMYPYPERVEEGRLGKGFYEWATEKGYRWHGDECRISNEGQAVGPDDFLPRRLMGEYLQWFYDVLCAEAPPNLAITRYAASAIDVEPLPSGRERVHLDDGRHVMAEHVVLTTGHGQGDPGFAASHGMSSSSTAKGVMSAYPVEAFIGSVAPSDKVAVEGMGLVALDVVTALTVGLGGSYATAPNGGLRYRPSGREPSLYLFSRGGFPYCAKSLGAADPVGDYKPAICTPERVASLKRGEDGSKRQIDARRELLPLVFAEMELRYYTVAAAIAGGAEVAGRVHRDLLDAWRSGAFDEARSGWARAFGTFSASDVFFLGDGAGYADSQHYQSRVYTSVEEDVAAALVSGGATPLKAALETLRALRDTIRTAVEFKGLTLGSHLDFQDNLRGRFARLVAGPPAFRSQQLLALMAAGVVAAPFGPAPEVLPMPDGSFTVRSTRLASRFEMDVDRIIRAHTDFPSVERPAGPLIANLVARGRVRPLSFDQATAGSIDLTEDFHPLDKYGRPQRNLWVFGVITEGVRYFTLYVPSPKSRVRAFMDAEACVLEILGGSLRRLPTAPGEGLVVRRTTEPSGTGRATQRVGVRGSEGPRRQRHGRGSERTRIALVNGMPDGAFEETERQFERLLVQEGSAGVPVDVELYALPGVPRSPAVQALIDERYWDLDRIWLAPPDAVVLTGAEPKTADLREELYWPALEELLRWARSEVPSMLVSCLSAHGALWAFDRVPRRLLLQKCSGVYEHRVDSDHPLMAGVGSLVLPHSRFNEVTAEDLVRAGYRSLAQSVDGAWAVAVGQRGVCQLLLLQGHPEYAQHTLLREYRRDVRRYLSGDYGSYPHVPTGYLDADGVAVLVNFEDRVHAGPRDPAMMEEFPYEVAARHVCADWGSSSSVLMGNWLRSLHRRIWRRTAEARVPAVP